MYNNTVFTLICNNNDRNTLAFNYFCKVCTINNCTILLDYFNVGVTFLFDN